MMRFSILLLFFILSLPALAESYCRCQPNQACWPSETEWKNLSEQLTGQLVRPVSPISVCEKDAASSECIAALKNIHNPFYIASNPGATQSQGWINAWQNHASEYAIEVTSTADVVAAVNFAREHQLRLVIKGSAPTVVQPPP